MPQTQSNRRIPSFLNHDQFKIFVLPHLNVGSRRLPTKLSLKKRSVTTEISQIIPKTAHIIHPISE